MISTISQIKIWHQTVSLLREECPGYGLGTLCGLFGYSRQSYYKWDSREFAENVVEPLIVEKVSEYRKNNPGLGCAKLYLIVKRLFEDTGSMPGRDVFIELLRKNSLMVRLKRRRHYRTTDSRHHYRKYPNLIADMVSSRLIHHSDRGCQYCSNEYVSELKKHHVSISMTQSGDPLENAIAERANGILKVEWLYKMRIPTMNAGQY